MIARLYGKCMFSYVESLQLSSKVALPFWIPISNEFLLLYILTSIWCYQGSVF